jgi:hypothetical protein
MKHVLSTHLFVNHRLTSALLGKIPGLHPLCGNLLRASIWIIAIAQIAELRHWFRDSD